MTDLFTGKVQSGTGRGAKFISLPIYEQIFEEELGKKPFYGTLNLKIDKESAQVINQAFSNGKVYEDLVYEGKEYGGIIIVQICIKINGKTIDAVAVRPHLTSHDSDIVELVSHKHLREFLDLDDGDTVTFALM